MKKYLLIAGNNYYPGSGTRDWIACFPSWEEAKEAITTIEEHGKPKYSSEYYIINDSKYDWYQIVNLTEWING